MHFCFRDFFEFYEIYGTCYERHQMAKIFSTCSIPGIAIYTLNQFIFVMNLYFHFSQTLRKYNMQKLCQAFFVMNPPPPPKKSTQIKTWCTTTALEYAYCEIQISKPKLSANQFSELINSVASDVNMFQR